MVIKFLIIFLIIILSIFTTQVKDKKSIENVVQEEIVSISVPRKIIIPSIKVNANIEPVGITKLGIMDTPKEVSNVGWFKLGPKPGDVGSAVMTGHFDVDNGSDAVFYNLSKLVVGDKIYTEASTGEKYTFIIKDIKKYKEEYAEEVFSSNDISHLNLITCSGIWDNTKNAYDNRLVIFSDLITEI